MLDDLNGDGKEDLVVGGGRGGELAVYGGDGAGNFVKVGMGSKGIGGGGRRGGGMERGGWAEHVAGGRRELCWGEGRGGERVVGGRCFSGR
ncbi:MAG: VCBS repeat-containing protein [Verrucomicrobiota bacterium]